MSMLVKAEAAIPMATLSQKDGSGESVFLLANLRNATRRQVCGQVLPMACGQEVDVILSALRAHPNDKRVAVACLKLYDMGLFLDNDSWFLMVIALSQVERSGCSSRIPFGRGSRVRLSRAPSVRLQGSCPCIGCC